MTILIAPAVSAAMGIPNNMPDVIDALKRLERIGSENSKTVEKIIEAAKELSATIVKAYALREGEMLSLRGGAGATRPSAYVIAHGLLRFQEEPGMPEVFRNRELALRFANDIANGLLDAIAKVPEAPLQPRLLTRAARI